MPETRCSEEAGCAALGGGASNSREATVAVPEKALGFAGITSEQIAGQLPSISDD